MLPDYQLSCYYTLVLWRLTCIVCMSTPLYKSDIDIESIPEPIYTSSILCDVHCMSMPNM